MDILAARRSIEQRLLKQSVALMLLVAISGTIMGVITGSSAVLLDVLKIAQITLVFTGVFEISSYNRQKN